MKHLRQVGVAGIIVASLAAVPAATPASASARVTPRPATPSNVVAQRRLACAKDYEQRLTSLGNTLNSDPIELEFRLSRLAHGQDS